MENPRPAPLVSPGYFFNCGFCIHLDMLKHVVFFLKRRYLLGIKEIPNSLKKIQQNLMNKKHKITTYKIKCEK